jgi:hypothetical protein
MATERRGGRRAVEIAACGEWRRREGERSSVKKKDEGRRGMGANG